jgi:pyruvate dehydrogenase E1 component alpha subunit
MSQFLNAKDLMDFERDIEQLFAAGAIKSPVHLAGGNEHELIRIFSGIKSYDWVLCTWRAHYHALLRGVPPTQVKKAILDGHSIALCFPAYKFLSSALVGGICPIATGIAWAIKRRHGREVVHCFVGDMAVRTGIYHECQQYCMGHDLPVHWIIEDNGKSVTTNTREVWGKGVFKTAPDKTVYQYELNRPHVGIGTFVVF